MLDQNIALPSKPKVTLEEGFKGVYEIDGLYPGYGHTLGNSLRRIILSSLPGSAITEMKIEGVGHEFSTIDGIKEDVIAIILNLKKIRVKLDSEESQTINLKIKGINTFTAGDIELPSQVQIMNPDLEILTSTDKNIDLNIELKVENGLGYVPKEILHKDRVDIGSIALDGVFTPIRRVFYETHDMRVGDKTNFNRLIVSIETDGTITPREALEKSIGIMITQLKAIVGFKEEVEIPEVKVDEVEEPEMEDDDKEDFLKTRVENIGLSPRTINALENANIRTVGGLARKKEEDILDLEGLGSKGLEEIKKVLGKNNIDLK
jgi:DNA-directed RNA polymerase subunit alpha